mmetsp:Transcript_192/g.554  ORF Transcript_192/g.554 Transcript_192/m.554 type:complete len:215 (-) Transcript_192:476-1120(-)
MRVSHYKWRFPAAEPVVLAGRDVCWPEDDAAKRKSAPVVFFFFVSSSLRSVFLLSSLAVVMMRRSVGHDGEAAGSAGLDGEEAEASPAFEPRPDLPKVVLVVREEAVEVVGLHRRRELRGAPERGRAFEAEVDIESADADAGTPQRTAETALDAVRVVHEELAVAASVSADGPGAGVGGEGGAGHEGEVVVDTHAETPRAPRRPARAGRTAEVR